MYIYIYCPNNICRKVVHFRITISQHLKKKQHALESGNPIHLHMRFQQRYTKGQPRFTSSWKPWSYNEFAHSWVFCFFCKCGCHGKNQCSYINVFVWFETEVAWFCFECGVLFCWHFLFCLFCSVEGSSLGHFEAGSFKTGLGHGARYAPYLVGRWGYNSTHGGLNPSWWPFIGAP